MSEQLKRLPSSSVLGGGKAQRLARLRVELEIQGLCVRHGVERIGFLTFTFADDVRTIKEAQRRFNSLNTGGLAGRYAEWIGVVQRHADNRIHFHLVVVMAQDIRTGFDFEAVKRRDYSSASVYLKQEWAFLRALMPEYSFGRHELLPVRITAGFGRYVARYVGRAGNTRQDEKGARLVRFSKGFQRTIVGPFSKCDAIETRARERLPVVVHSLRFRDVAHLESQLGTRWKYHLARILYCSEAAFQQVLAYADRDLDLYGGRMLALTEAFERWDGDAPKRALEDERRQILDAHYREIHERERLLQGTGARGAPDRPEAVARRQLPGEIFLAR